MLPAFVAPLPLNSHAVLVPNVCPVCLQHGGGPDPAAHTPKLVFDFTVFDHNVAVTGGAMFLSGGRYTGHTAMDVTSEDQQPSLNNSWFVVFYFVTFVMIGSVLLTQVFMAVIIVNYQRAQGKVTCLSN